MIQNLKQWFFGLRRWRQIVVVCAIVVVIAAPLTEKGAVAVKPTPTPLATPAPNFTPDCTVIGIRVFLYPKPQPNLQNCNFADRSFQRDSHWGEADLRGANFSGSTIRYSDFSFADLRSANFSGAILEGADFTNANVSGADFSGAILKCITDDNTNWSEALNVSIISRGSCFD